MNCDLIVGVGSGSDGSRGLGARGGGAGHRRRVSAVARGSGSPDFTNSGTPVAKSSGAWIWDKLRDMRNPPRALAGLGEARGCGCDGGGRYSVWILSRMQDSWYSRYERI
jgi:hypothetical protein